MPAADADGLDAGVPLTVSRRVAVAAAAWAEDTTADGRAVARAAGADIFRAVFGAAAWEGFELWAAPVSADAAPIPELRAAPIPSATANPPTRPMHVDAVMVSSIRDSWPPHGHFRPT